MHLFCLSYDVRCLDEQRLSDALSTAGRPFPRFADGDRWAVTSDSGTVVVAGLHHPREMVGPRTYSARAGEVVAAFDGWPVHRSGRWRGCDAAVLLSHWDELPEVAEGQFAALRVDLASDEVSFVTDAFGISPLYHVAHGGGHVVANSVEVLRLLVGAATPSPLGVSSFAAMGWATGDTTLLAGISAVSGGAQYSLDRRGLVPRPYMTAATVAAGARSGRRVATADVVSEMVELTAAAARGDNVECGLTAGRDSRLVLALLLASGAADVRVYTGGSDGDSDVEGARRIARELGLKHELRQVDVLDAVDRVALVSSFVSQTDGLSSLIQIGDYHDQLRAEPTLGIKMPGLGGEMGRCGVRTGPFAANVPLFTVSARAQEQLVIERAHQYRDLLTDDALNEVATRIREFMRERRAEGWKVRELGEAHYAFDRVTRWGAAGSRRLSPSDDLFSPYCSRAYVTYCFSLTPEERYVEAAHYRMLSVLSPQLRDMPFAKPWRRQAPRQAPMQASYELGRAFVSRLARSSPVRRSEPPPAAAPFWVRFFDSHLQDHLEVCLSVPDSPLWSFIDRAGVEQAFRGEPGSRARAREGLMRVLTLFWYFHGRHLR